MDLANITVLIATFVHFSAVILVSYAMLRETPFRRTAAYVGIVGGIVALLFIPTFVLGSPLSGLFNLAGVVLLFIWSVIVVGRSTDSGSSQPIRDRRREADFSTDSPSKARCWAACPSIGSRRSTTKRAASHPGRWRGSSRR